jgi:hypothetical protein
MPNNQIQLTYSAVAVSVTPAVLSAAMQAVSLYSIPNDPVLGQILGLTVASDVPSITGSVVSRVITLNMDYTAGAPSAPPVTTVHPQAVDGSAAVYSSSALDTAGGSGAQAVLIGYLDADGNAGSSRATLGGQTPVPIALTPGTKGVASVTSMAVVSSGALDNNMGQITVKVFTPPAVGAVPPPPMTEQDFLQNALGDTLAFLPASYYSYATPTPPAPTTIVVPSAKQSLPQPTLYVESTAGYPPAGTIDVTTSAGVQTVAYTGKTDATVTTPATFTGASGGTGVMSQNDPVSFPLQTLPALLIAGLSNYFTNALSLALATQVVAATPVLV